MKHLQSNSELQEKALLYGIGALPEEERRDYARHLEEDDCQVCAAESLEFQNVAQSLAINVPAQTPSAAVKARLMAQVRAESSTVVPAPEVRPKRSAWQWIGWPVAAAAAAALAIILNMNVGLRRQVDALAIRVTQLEGEVTRNQTQMVALTDPRLTVVNLAGQGNTPQASGRIFWSKTDRRWMVYVVSLPPVPADRAYQLWFVTQDGTKLSAQVFNTEADGSAMLDLQLPPGATSLMAAAVTTEPAGGLPQPSGAFVLLGM